MNTIGKILVILNLVFALVVGGFLVIDFGARTNWKNAFDKLKAEMTVAGGNYDTSNKTLSELNSQVRKALAKKEELEKTLAEEKIKADAVRVSLETQVRDATEKAKDADLAAQKAIGEKEALKQEVVDLSGTVQKRDKTILDLREDNQDLRNKAIFKDNLATATQARNVDLLAQIQELQRKLALREAGVGADGGLTRDPNAPNPPSVYVKGRIDRVDARDRNLVQISIGTDQGIKQNHTLVVYRVSPEPAYLGMIRIRDAKEHSAVGQLMSSTAATPRLQPGDIVASSIMPPSP